MMIGMICLVLHILKVFTASQPCWLQFLISIWYDLILPFVPGQAGLVHKIYSFVIRNL